MTLSDGKENKRVKLNESCSAQSDRNRSSSLVMKPLSINRMRSNAYVLLVFVDLDQSGGLVYHETQPTFTHQVFGAEEEITFLDDPTGSRVVVLVNCFNGADHLVVTCGAMSDSEHTTLASLLKCFLPEGIEFLRSHTGALPPPPSLLREIKTVDKVQKWTVPKSSHICPPGTKVGSFEGKAGELYEFWLASNEDASASALLKRCESVATWLIETADGVDFEGDSRWEVLFCTRPLTRANSCFDANFVLAGYMTLFTFNNPFAGPKIRVCQVVTLPQYQGKGLGRQMLLEVYKLVHSRALSEVTVEDPAPGFQRLRDVVDCEVATRHCVAEYKRANGFAEDERLNPLSALWREMVASIVECSDAAAVGKALRITVSQAQFVLHALRFYQVVRPHDPTFVVKKIVENDSREEEEGDESVGDDEEDEETFSFEASDEYRALRIAVKRQLLKDNRELKTLDKPAMQRELDALFGEEELRLRAAYAAVCRQLAKL